MANYLLAVDNVTKAWQFLGFSSTVNASFANAEIKGIAWLEPDVYYGSTTGPSYKKGTGFSATVQSSFSYASAADGMAFDSSGNLSISVFGDANMKRFSGFSSTITASFSIGTAPRGITSDGTNAYTGSDVVDGPNKYRKQSGFTSTVTSSFVAGANVSRDCAWDGTNFIGSGNNAGTGLLKLYTGFTSTVSSSFTKAVTSDLIGIDWQIGAEGGGTVRDARKLTLLGVG